MHLRDMEAVRAVLPLLYFFCPSGLDDVSRPIQELALSPYVVNEAKRGVIYGITSYASVPPVTPVFRALFQAESVLFPDPSKSKPQHQYSYKLDTPSFQVSLPCSLELAQEPPARSICSRLDAPDLANISRMFQDSPDTHCSDFYSLSVRLLASRVILLFITVFLLLLLRKFILEIYNGKSPASTVIYWFKIFVGITSCGILGNHQLPMDADPQGAILVLLAGSILGITCGIGRMIRSSAAPTGLNRVPVLANSAAVPTNLQDSQSATNIQTRSHLALLPVSFNSAMQTGAVTLTEPEVNIGIQTGVVQLEAVKAGMSTQSGRVMMDVGIQTISAPTPPQAFNLDREVKTDTVTSVSLADPPADLNVQTGKPTLSPATSVMVDDGIQMDMTTLMIPIHALLPIIPTTDADVEIEYLTPIPTKEVTADDKIQMDLYMASALTCGLAPTLLPQYNGTENLALGTATTAEPTAAATIDVDSQTEDRASLSTKAAVINDGMPTNITRKLAVTDVLSAATPSEVAGHFPLTVTLRLSAQGITVVSFPDVSTAHALKEKFDEKKEKADMSASAIACQVTLRKPEEEAAPARPDVVPQSASGLKNTSVFTPTRSHVAVTQAPSRFSSQHPPPFRPPGLGYQPSRHIPVDPDSRVQQGPVLVPTAIRPATPSDKPPIRPRFPRTVTQSPQLLAPPALTTDLDNKPLPSRPPYGNSSLLLSSNLTTNPLAQQVTSVAISPRPATRPFMPSARDFTAEDPFSRSLTPPPIAPVETLTSRSEPSSAALRFIPRHVVPVPASGPSDLASRPLPGRFRPLSAPTPASPSSVPHTAPLADVHPLLKKAPSFWAPPRENSAVPVVPPPKRLRARTRVRSRRMNMGHPEELIENEKEKGESEDGHVATIGVAGPVLGGANNSARFQFRVAS